MTNNSKTHSQDHHPDFSNHKVVYGPVKSWRFGQSLGIDPIFETSTCSFNCIYCQLGHIQDITTRHKVYVPTQRVVDDFKEIYKNAPIDMITYSGSGEPTLALNLEEMIDEIRILAPQIPQMILTNATQLHDSRVRRALEKCDRVSLKIDTASEELFQKMNRPALGVTLDTVIKGIELFKKQFKGALEVQTMFMPINVTPLNKNLQDYIDLMKQIDPDVIQLNTPKRAYPMEWHRENRGNHLEFFHYDVRKLQTITKETALEIEEKLSKALKAKIISISRSL